MFAPVRNPGIPTDRRSRSVHPPVFKVAGVQRNPAHAGLDAAPVRVERAVVRPDVKPAADS